jgi:hypothetical protein
MVAKETDISGRCPFCREPLILIVHTIGREMIRMPKALYYCRHLDCNYELWTRYCYYPFQGRFLVMDRPNHDFQ